MFKEGKRKNKAPITCRSELKHYLAENDGTTSNNNSSSRWSKMLVMIQFDSGNFLALFFWPFAKNCFEIKQLTFLYKYLYENYGLGLTMCG